ncbi:MAG: Ig-like domain-containing protein, partial [Flavobacteriaceae bacterium]
VSVSVSANDPNGSIVKHQIYVDGKLVDTDGSKFTPHKITNISEGNHVIRATVTDNSGEKATATINITATASPNSGSGGSNQPPATGNNLPSVTILAPTKNQNFAVGATVSVKLSATDSDGSIVQHKIYVNGKLVDTDGSKFTPHKIINVKSGTYPIKATVTDNDGGTASQTTSFNVQGSTQKQAPVTVSQPYRELHIFDRVTDQIRPKEDLPYLKVLRNPVKDGLLQIRQHGNTYLRIVNLSGITVKELALKEENLEINLSGLAPGLYILSSDIATSKFILD